MAIIRKLGLLLAILCLVLAIFGCAGGEGEGEPYKIGFTLNLYY